MISVAAAKEFITSHRLIIPAEIVPLQECLHRRLASPVYSETDVPGFTQSSMDGYAFTYTDWQPGKPLPVQGEMQAGTKQGMLLAPGYAARIFTGAPLPTSADTVVMQEKTTVTNGLLDIEDATLAVGVNVRAAGSAIKKAALALEANSLLTPGAIGFLTGMGITAVSVYGAPSIAIIVTGNELQQAGKPLAFAEIYESNAIALQTALQQHQLHNVKTYAVPDDPEKVKQVLEQALAMHDLILLTGGVSVGDYDFVVQAAGACGIQQVFHKIKQRPGKPLYFGIKGDKRIFGLPGNPSSVLSCFYQYVLLVLQLPLPVLMVPLAKAVKKPAGLTHFLKAWYKGDTVEVLDAQESYRMSSFAKANCLVELNETITDIADGSPVPVHLLPF
jgi:molybdopterin molybdotransferase